MATNEFQRLTDRVAYLPGGTNIGLIDGEGAAGAVLVDTGNDKDSARRIQKAAEGYGRTVSAAVLTHSNADHAGGAAALIDRTGIPIFAARLEASICADPIVEPSFLWGGFPPAELRGKFFVSPPCAVVPFPFPLGDDPVVLDEPLSGLRALPLGGHYFAQVGFLADGILFAGDAVFGQESIAKHPVIFVYDVAAFLASLDRVAASGARMVVPSHGSPTEDIPALVAINRVSVERTADAVVSACAAASTAEAILRVVAAAFSVQLDWAQYALVGSTVRSYLVYLRELGKLEAIFEDGLLLWRRL
jgi:glyoxylase-like metal-dependent hydrolase (beta-lactamase superfamily II)